MLTLILVGKYGVSLRELLFFCTLVGNFISVKPSQVFIVIFKMNLYVNVCISWQLWPIQEVTTLSLKIKLTSMRASLHLLFLLSLVQMNKCALCPNTTIKCSEQIVHSSIN